MLSIRTLIIVAVVSLFASVGNAQVQMDHDHTVTATGANEAQAQQVAEAKRDAYIQGFEAGLDPGDWVIGFTQKPRWIAATQTYEIKFTIHWMDEPAPSREVFLPLFR